MATSVPTSPHAAAPLRSAPPGMPPAKTVPAAAGPVAPGTALVAAQAAPKPLPGIPEDSPALRLKVELEVSVPVGDFRVRNLLSLDPGVVVESQWNHSEDLPLAAGRVQLAFTEFEVVDTQLASRLTRLA